MPITRRNFSVRLKGNEELGGDAIVSFCATLETPDGHCVEVVGLKRGDPKGNGGKGTVMLELSVVENGPAPAAAVQQ